MSLSAYHMGFLFLGFLDLWAGPRSIQLWAVIIDVSLDYGPVQTPVEALDYLLRPIGCSREWSGYGISFLKTIDFDKKKN